LTIPAVHRDRATLPSGVPKRELPTPSTSHASSLATAGTTADGGPIGSSHWPHAGVTLGRYVLRRRIGIGGMGEVWAAHDVELDRDVAIKLVRARDAAAAGMQFERLAREARALARVSDPHVVQVYDVGTYSHEAIVHGVFVVMELVRGLSLDQWVSVRAPDPAQILDAFDAAARGLAAAHAAGLVHRDFKPSNVFVGDDGRVRVGDFGLARTAESSASVEAVPFDESRPRAIDDTVLGTLTRTGAMAGTPLYMAPEQHALDTIDARSDQYSFCVALWEASFGVRPFAGTAAELLAAKRVGPPSRPSAARPVPRAIEGVLRRGLATDPRRRWPDMTALLDALRRARGRNRKRMLATVAALAVVAAVGGLVALDEPHSQCPEIRPAALTSEQRELLQPHERAAAIADEYLAAIHRARLEVCERPPPERASALQCLRSAAVQAESTVDLIGQTARADLDIGALLGGLPVVERCLEAPTTSAPIERVEPAVQERLDDLGRGQTLVRGERFHDALEIAESVVAAIDDGRVDGRVLRTPAMHLRAKALDGMAVNERSQAALTDVYFAAVEQGDHDIAFDSARALAHGFAQRFALEDARRWMRHAETEAAHLPSSSETAIALATTHGAIAIGSSDFEAAEQYFRGALDVCPAATCSRRARLSLNLAETLERLDRIPEAAEAGREALDLLVSTYGAESPATIRARVEVVSVLRQLSRMDEAEAELAIAEPLIEKWLGPYDTVRPVAFALRGHLASSRGDVTAMIAAYEDAMAAMDPADTEDEMRFVPHLNDLANAYHAAGRATEALATLVRAHEITMRAAPKSFEHGVIQTSLGGLRAQLGDPEGGARDLTEAIALLQPMLGPAHDVVMRARHNLGAALKEAGRTRDAEVVLARLHDDLRDAPPASEGRVGTALALAACREELGDLAGARAAISTLDGVVLDDPRSVEQLEKLRARLFPRRAR
jgi:eukaryotic-like serine/threonine-protein kinase